MWQNSQIIVSMRTRLKWNVVPHLSIPHHLLAYLWSTYSVSHLPARGLNLCTLPSPAQKHLGYWTGMYGRGSNKQEECNMVVTWAEMDFKVLLLTLSASVLGSEILCDSNSFGFVLSYFPCPTKGMYGRYAQQPIRKKKCLKYIAWKIKSKCRFWSKINK